MALDCHQECVREMDLLDSAAHEFLGVLSDPSRTRRCHLLTNLATYGPGDSQAPGPVRESQLPVQRHRTKQHFATES